MKNIFYVVVVAFFFYGCAHSNLSNGRNPATWVQEGHVYHSACETNYMGTSKASGNDFTEIYMAEVAASAAQTQNSSLLGHEPATCAIFAGSTVKKGRNVIVYLSSAVSHQKVLFSRCIPYSEYHGTNMGSSSNDLNADYVATQAKIIAGSSQILLFDQITCAQGRAIKVVVAK